jgi:hypothetical protein
LLVLNAVIAWQLDVSVESVIILTPLVLHSPHNLNGPCALVDPLVSSQSLYLLNGSILIAVEVYNEATSRVFAVFAREPIGEGVALIEVLFATSHGTSGIERSLESLVEVGVEVGRGVFGEA